MDILHLIGYIGAIFVGLMLGLVGGGGSILTVPILIYLFSIDAVTATSYSLFIVAMSSAIGTISNFKNHLINYRKSFYFLISSSAAIFLTRNFILPTIPETILSLSDFTLTKDIFILIMFSLLMITSSFSMIRKTQFSSDSGSIDLQIPQLLLIGFSVGLLTGFVGAGGGFIIVPALYFLAGLEIKNAIATSLFIIAVNSSIGFMSDFHRQEIDWILLFTYSLLAVIGIISGQRLTKRISNEKLKPIFGWFVLMMGIFIFVRELFF